MSAVKEAFAAAGYRAADERLRDIAEEAWRKWSRAEGGGARRDFVMLHLRGELTWALMEQYQPQQLPLAVGLLLNRARQAIEDARPARDAGKPAGRGGQAKPDTQAGRALASNSRDRLRSVAGAVSEGAGSSSTPIVPAPPRSNLSAMADRQTRATAAKTATLIQLSRLDTVTVNGKPIGDCAVIEVRQWAATRRQDARMADRDVWFALALVSTLPGNAIIRQHWQNPAEVEAIYAKAEAEHAA